MGRFTKQELDFVVELVRTEYAKQVEEGRDWGESAGAFHLVSSFWHGLIKKIEAIEACDVEKEER